MIRLDSQTKSLQVFLSGAVTTRQLPIVVSYSDKTSSGYIGSTQESFTNNTTPVTICTPPPSSAQYRDIDYINIYNADTAAVTVTLGFIDTQSTLMVQFGTVFGGMPGGNFYQRDITLQIDDTLTYTHAAGWVVTSRAGSSIQVTSVFGRTGAVIAQAGDYTALQVTGALPRSSSVYTIGAANCDYTSIQAALNAHALGGELFLVYPGTYTDTINFTANGQCVIGMGTSSQQVVTQATTTICNVGAFTNCRAENITMTVSAATSAVGCITVSTGSMLATECFLNCTNSNVTTASQPFLTNVTSTGTLEIEEGEENYTNTVSDGTGVTAIKAAHIVGTGGTSFVERADITITGGGLSLGIAAFYSPSSGRFVPSGNELFITDTAASYVVGYFSAGTGTLSELNNNLFHVTGGGSNSVIGVWLSGTATITSHFNHYQCFSGLTNYVSNLAVGSTLNSMFDAIQASSGRIGAGQFNLLNSEDYSDNSIINGEHLIAQVATSGTLTAGGSTTATTYTTDMHHAWCTGANVAWAQVAGSQTFKNAIQFTGAASVTAVGHGTRIESVNAARHANQPVTLSVWMSNSLLTSVTWTAYYVNVADTFGTNGSGAKTQIATGTITLTAADTTLRQYSVSFPAGANAGNGMTIEFTVGAQTSGTWVITGEDLWNGLSRPYPHERKEKALASCQTYFQVIPVHGIAVSSGVIAANKHPDVFMRVTPTATYSNGASGIRRTVDGAFRTGTGVTVGTSQDEILYYSGTWSVALVAGECYDGGGGATITLSARL